MQKEVGTKMCSDFFSHKYPVRFYKNLQSAIYHLDKFFDCLMTGFAH